MSRRRRPAIRSVALLATVITAGLASRRFPFVLPILIRKRTGDALWASAAFAGVGLLRPSWSTRVVVGWAVAVSFADEFSQAYHSPWIDRLRSHTLGHLILGSGFHWLDLLAYVVGVAAVVPVDVLWILRPRRIAGAGDELPESACVR